MTVLKICRNAIKPFEQKTVSQQNFYNKDSKNRCPYSDKKFTHLDRLAKHTENNEIICFNFLHKLTTGGFEGKLFTSETMVHYDNKYMRMCDIEFATIAPQEHIIAPEEEFDLEDYNDFVTNENTIENLFNSVSKLEKTHNDIIESLKHFNFNFDSENIDIMSNDTENLYEDIYMPNDVSDNEIDIMSNIVLDFDDDEDLLEVKKNEYDRIIDVINENPNSEINFYKSCDKTLFNQFIMIMKTNDNEYMVGNVFDFDDVEFVNWKTSANNSNDYKF